VTISDADARRAAKEAAAACDADEPATGAAAKELMDRYGLDEKGQPR